MKPRSVNLRSYASHHYAILHLILKYAVLDSSFTNKPWFSFFSLGGKNTLLEIKVPESCTSHANNSSCNLSKTLKFSKSQALHL